MQTVKPLDISAIDIIPRPTQGKTALPRTTDEVWTFPADTHQVLSVCAAITKMSMIMTTMTTMRFGSYLTLPGDTPSTPRLCHHNEDDGGDGAVVRGVTGVVRLTRGRYPPSDLECLSCQDSENIAHC